MSEKKTLNEGFWERKGLIVHTLCTHFEPLESSNVNLFFGICRDHRLCLWFLISAVWARHTPTPRAVLQGPLWLCLLPKGAKVFNCKDSAGFKDCGLNKNAAADSWFSLTAASAPSLCSQFRLGPKWQLWSRRAITVLPQCSANNRRSTPQPHVNSGAQMKPE